MPCFLSVLGVGISTFFSLLGKFPKYRRVFGDKIYFVEISTVLAMFPTQFPASISARAISKLSSLECVYIFDVVFMSACPISWRAIFIGTPCRSRFVQ